MLETPAPIFGESILWQNNFITKVAYKLVKPGPDACNFLSISGTEKQLFITLL